MALKDPKHLIAQPPNIAYSRGQRAAKPQFMHENIKHGTLQVQPEHGENQSSWIQTHRGERITGPAEALAEQPDAWFSSFHDCQVIEGITV